MLNRKKRKKITTYLIFYNLSYQLYHMYLKSKPYIKFFNLLYISYLSFQKYNIKTERNKELHIIILYYFSFFRMLASLIILYNNNYR